MSLKVLKIHLNYETIAYIKNYRMCINRLNFVPIINFYPLFLDNFKIFKT